MRADPKKCHFISITNDGVNLKNENQIMANIKCEKRLDMKFDCKLSFNAHINDICKKELLKLKCFVKNRFVTGFNKNGCL